MDKKIIVFATVFFGFFMLGISIPIFDHNEYAGRLLAGAGATALLLGNAGTWVLANDFHTVGVERAKFTRSFLRDRYFDTMQHTSLDILRFRGVLMAFSWSIILFLTGWWLDRIPVIAGVMNYIAGAFLVIGTIFLFLWVFTGLNFNNNRSDYGQ